MKRRLDRSSTTYQRYVAIGDSTTEGLEDGDDIVGYRGWANRLAEHIAAGQSEPLEYANLAIRGRELPEIHREQLAPALAMRPDLMTIVGGVNDATRPRADLQSARGHLAAMFFAARRTGAEVLTFTMPDPAAVNPVIGRVVRRRMFALNQIVREEAGRYGVRVLDFERYPVAVDPQLWFVDRLHASPLGHERIARGLAWRLGVPGHDESWADPVSVAEHVSLADRLNAERRWQRDYFFPWIARAVRGVSSGDGRTPKLASLVVVQSGGNYQAG